jgi:hypothetical protein
MGSTGQFIIWNGRGNQRIRPWGLLCEFDTPEEAERVWRQFESHLRGCGIVPPHATIKALSDVTEHDAALTAAVYGVSNNCE